MKTFMQISTRRRRLTVRTVLITCALVGLMACASKPEVPEAAIQGAERAIIVAERSQTQGYQSAELSEARSKLVRARAAVQQEKMVLARQLATESMVNAELAAARAEHYKAKAINEDMLRGIEALKQETQRNTGERQ